MTPGETSMLRIRTPEGVVFSLPLAGPVTRFMGWLVDGLIVVVINIVSLFVIGTLSTLVGNGIMLIWFLIALVVPVCYGMFFEWLWGGQTIGKKIMKLRVIDETGLRLSGSQIVMRNLLRAVDSLPPMVIALEGYVVPVAGIYVVGGIASLCTKHCQRLGDIAAGTVVVRSTKERVPEVEGILEGKYNSFRDHAHLEARLRQRVSPDEAQVVLAALMRRGGMDPEARIELFQKLAGHFRRVVEFPEEVTLGMTDEQYLRNVADSLFRRRKRN